VTERAGREAVNGGIRHPGRRHPWRPAALVR